MTSVKLYTDYTHGQIFQKPVALNNASGFSFVQINELTNKNISAYDTKKENRKIAEKTQA